MNEIRVFEHKKFGKVRAVVIDGEPWFVAKDVAVILGYNNPRDAVRNHIYDDDKGVEKIDTPGGKQKFTIVNESGIYSLIFGSRKTDAKEFKHWVTSEILPSVRKYGFYATDDVLEQFLNDPDMAIGVFSKLKEEREKVRRLECENKELSEKCSYLDLITRSPDAVPITVIAKDYDMSACEMNQTLHHLGVQYKMKCGTWVLYQEHVGNGYTRSKTFVCDEKSFSSSVHTYWTQKGRKFIYEILRENGILPLCERRCKV